MAVHKAIRSNAPAQPEPKPERPSSNHQLKADLFEALRHINRDTALPWPRSTGLKSKTASRRPAPSLSAFCMTTATARRLFAPWPTATFSACWPDAKSTKPSALALRLKNQIANAAAPDRHHHGWRHSRQPLDRLSVSGRLKACVSHPTGLEIARLPVTRGLTTPASQNRAFRGPGSAPGLGSFAPPGWGIGLFAIDLGEKR